MKTLSQHTKTNSKILKLPYKQGCRSFNEYLSINNIDENFITDDELEYFINVNYRRLPHFSGDDYNTRINEMLKTHEVEKLLKWLNLHFNYCEPTIIVDKYKESGTYHKITFIKVDKEIINKHLDEFKLVLDNHMWFCSKVYVNDNILAIEPIEADNVTDFVKNKCKGIVYHVTSSSNIKSIKRTGLRAKGETNDYRFIKNRVYFVVGESKTKLIKAIQRIIEDKALIDYRIISIDVNKASYDINFYRNPDGYDDVMQIYSYAFFPHQIIENIYDDITKL